MKGLCSVSSCPECRGRLHPLFWIRREGVPHDEEGHNVVFRVHAMDRCVACDRAVLEVYSHDCWSRDEPWDMFWWYVMAADDLVTLLRLLAPCPAPLNPSCECPVHASMRHSSERLWGNIRHRTGPPSEIPYARMRVEVRDGRPVLVV